MRRKHTIRNNRRSRGGSRRNIRGGGCGCKSSFYGGGGGRRTRRRNLHNPLIEKKMQRGGCDTCNIKMNGGARRLIKQRGGGWFDPILGRVFSNNIVTGFNSVSSESAPNLLYGTTKVESGNPTSQPVNFYSRFNPQMA